MPIIGTKVLLAVSGLALVLSSCSAPTPLMGRAPGSSLQAQSVSAMRIDDILLQGNQGPAPINDVFHGTVTKLLPDDNQGLKHEKFMFQVADGHGGQFNGQTVTVAHDTTYAPYVPVKVGTQLEIKGDMLAGPKVLHWTHKAKDPQHPNPTHADGYIKMDGKIYQ